MPLTALGLPSSASIGGILVIYLLCAWSAISPSSQPASDQTTEAAKLGRCKQAMEDGQFGKAGKILSSDGLAAVSLEVYQEMLSKHPSPPSSSVITAEPSTASNDEFCPIPTAPLY